MAATHSSASPMPGPSQTPVKNKVADSLYNWCRNSQPFGHVFQQADLLAAGIIPNSDLQILLNTTQDLVNRNLFKIHDLKNSGGLIGWELISHERAANYTGLDRNERMVFSIIDSAGTQGIWIKTIKNRLTAHTNVLDRIYKTLEGRGLIKRMKNVQHPTRRMYILSTLQPSEDATGGAWYTDGSLDSDLMEHTGNLIEQIVSERSWAQVTVDNESSEPINGKRKTPMDGFDPRGKGKAKVVKIDDNPARSLSPELHTRRPKKHVAKTVKSYLPREAGYDRYPTLREITRAVADSGMVKTAIPDNAIRDLLEVMVYDDRLFKMTRPIREEEAPDNANSDTITMYRCFKTPPDVRAYQSLPQRAGDLTKPSHAKAARRQLELEEVGRGGTSEVPCMQCPAFELCGDGGPVNVNTCVYYDEWFAQAARADRNVDQPWPDGDDFITTCEERRDKRLMALDTPNVKVKVEPQTVDLT